MTAALTNSGPTAQVSRLGLWSALAVGVSIALGGFAAPAKGQALNPSLQKLQTDVPAQARGLDVEEHIGQTLPMELPFTNAQGQQVRLGDYFNKGKPAIIAMVYYNCPIVCDVVMSRIAETISGLDYKPGTDFNALFFSIDPNETTQDAHQRKLRFLSSYSGEVTPQVEAGWEFHTGDEVASRHLAEALGFQYRKIDTGKYSHPVVIFIVTPEGKISRYIYGYVYPVRDVKLALMDATQGKLIKTIGDRFINFCYEYDPKSGSYTLQAVRVMQIGGILTVVALGTLIGGLFVGERLRRNRAHRLTGSAPASTPDNDPASHTPEAGAQP